MYFNTQQDVNFEKEKNTESYQKKIKIIWCSRGDNPLQEFIIFLLVRIDLFSKMWWEIKSIDFKWVEIWIIIKDKI